MQAPFPREPCPWLPLAEEFLGPEVTRHLPEKDETYYLAALRYAQSLWGEGKPAQAILQLNKAWMADLEGREGVLEGNPPPYRALRWIMRNAKSGGMGFMGNPVRHFQHLASRISGPRLETRRWRAWACFHLAGMELGESGAFPCDGEQIAREGLWIPGWERTKGEIEKRGWRNELDSLLAAVSD